MVSEETNQWSLIVITSSHPKSVSHDLTLSTGANTVFATDTRFRVNVRLGP